jgi:hypothetical protein
VGFFLIFIIFIMRSNNNFVLVVRVVIAAAAAVVVIYVHVSLKLEQFKLSLTFVVTSTQRKSSVYELVLCIS